jgi:ribonuclease HI
VSAKVKALFGEWASYHRHPRYNRELEEKEELWLAQFKIQLQTGNTVNTITQENWEIRTGRNDFEKWKNERKAYILSFDGASKGNPGQARGGGIIVKPNAEVMVRYAIGLGNATNNYAEAMALWQGLCQARRNGIRNLTIIGDSRMLINAIIRSSKTQSAQLNNVLARIRLLLKRLDSYQVFHVLRELNKEADEEANRGALLAQGCMNISGQLTKVDIP